MEALHSKVISNKDFESEAILHVKETGTNETDFFFPFEQKTIRAVSLEEAIKKLKNLAIK